MRTEFEDSLKLDLADLQDSFKFDLTAEITEVINDSIASTCVVARGSSASQLAHSCDHAEPTSKTSAETTTVASGSAEALPPAAPTTAPECFVTSSATAAAAHRG